MKNTPVDVALGPEAKALLGKVDTSYAHDIAVRLTAFRTNERLGYRTAASQAELEAGKMLEREMLCIGLADVRREPISVDGWTFERAELRFTGADGNEHITHLGGYQTQLDTGGAKPFAAVYAGRGTEKDLSGLDVRGKLVLIDIEQRADWWINYPAYEAHLAGAVAVLAAQSGGFAEVADDALNAQDICGPAFAPALSISRRDADVLRLAIEAAGAGGTAVTLDAKSVVTMDAATYNVTGVIPGRRADELVLMTAHYDAYFEGFQDNSISVGIMLGIARAILQSGYRPQKTLVFCAIAAEEWGVSDTHYDWCAGAYQQIFHVHPEWAGKAIACINFELPGYDMAYHTAQVRASYELSAFVRAVGAASPTIEGRFPGGVETVTPTQTWSDDFSFSIAGVPSSVNKLHDDFGFSAYHTQYDDRSTYDEKSARFYFQWFGLLLLAYDRCAVSPLDFTTRLKALSLSADAGLMEACGADSARLLLSVDKARDAAAEAYGIVTDINEAYGKALSCGDLAGADAIAGRASYKEALALFKAAEDAFVRLTWWDEAVFPHEPPQNNLAMLLSAVDALRRGDVSAALDEYLMQVDNNRYAYHFSSATFRYFTGRVLGQPPERLQWGAGRTVGHEDLLETIRSLTAKAGEKAPDCAGEIAALNACIQRQKKLLIRLVGDEIRSVDSLREGLVKLISVYGQKHR